MELEESSGGRGGVGVGEESRVDMQWAALDEGGVYEISVGPIGRGEQAREMEDKRKGTFGGSVPDGDFNPRDDRPKADWKLLKTDPSGEARLRRD